MGVSTVSAARILEGQRRGMSGEENALAFENFPFVAFSKTYSVNQQTPDSAPTMTAMVTGVKTEDGILSVDQQVVEGDYRTVKGNELTTILELAEKRGLATGVVSTARLTHATPAACYAHTASRDWEADRDLSKDARAAGFPDIARQLIEFPFGDGLEVALGGGRSKFLGQSQNDPEDAGRRGERIDERDLPAEWLKKYPAAKYVWNKTDFAAVDARKTRHLLGLFERSHLEYEFDRQRDAAGEPSLTEMTEKAIDIVSHNKKGFFLMIEAGRIDHAHHEGNAFRALTETIELSNAVRAALKKVNLDETLVIVTADHSHTLSFSGYPTRGNNILGLVRANNQQGAPSDVYSLDLLGLPYTTLNYANGTGYTGAAIDQPGGAKTFPHAGNGFKPIAGGRPDLRAVDTASPNYLQEVIFPLGSETHGGEDVAVYADGAGAQLVHGVMEQNWIFHVMAEALGLTNAANN
jgi:alkaline phosphatase